MYKIKFTAQAKKEFKNISIRYKQVLTPILEEMKDSPFISKPLTREFTGKFSHKIGVYRIIYKVNKNDKIISVLTVGHRGRVYE